MNVDHRADIYSLGVMLYEMLCREVPKGVFAPPSQRIGCNSRIDKIIDKALQQAPEHRFQSMTEMKADVAAAGTAIDTQAAVSETRHPSAVESRPKQPERGVTEGSTSLPAVRSKVPLYASCIIGIIAFAITATVWMQRSKPQAARHLSLLSHPRAKTRQNSTMRRRSPRA